MRTNRRCLAAALGACAPRLAPLSFSAKARVLFPQWFLDSRHLARKPGLSRAQQVRDWQALVSVQFEGTEALFRWMVFEFIVHLSLDNWCLLSFEVLNGQENASSPSFDLT